MGTEPRKLMWPIPWEIPPSMHEIEGVLRCNLGIVKKEPLLKVPMWPSEVTEGKSWEIYTSDYI